MSITAETAKQHANDPAVLCCRAEEGTVLEPANFEDPAIFPDLIDSGLLNVDGALKLGQVLNGSKLTKTVDSLTPITADIVDKYDADEVEEEEPARPKVATRNTKVGKVIPIRKELEVTMIRPASVEESRIVVDNLKGGRAVVLNLEDVRTNIAQRIVDFICGAAYDMEGNLQSISDSIFIVTPPNIGLTGDFTDLLGSSGLSQDSADASGFGSRL